MKQDGGPAFPVTADVLCDHTSGTSVRLTGMTLRDYFAGQALTGLLAVPNGPQSGPDMYARDAYTVADAMLAERAQ